MKGRRLVWFELAAVLGLSVQRTQDETTATEFLDWQTFRNMQRAEQFEIQDKQDWYWAQLACEIRRSVCKDPSKYKVQDFLLRFKSSGKTVRTKNEEDTTDTTKDQKRLWLSMFGLKE